MKNLAKTLIVLTLALVIVVETCNIDVSAASSTEITAETGWTGEILAPLTALVGTNCICGYSEPNKVVYIEYNKKTYKAKAKSDGLYRIKVATLKKGKTFKIYVSGKKSEAKTFKVQAT